MEKGDTIILKLIFASGHPDDTIVYMSQMYGSLILIRKQSINKDRIIRNSHLIRNELESAHFVKLYKIAYSFFYNRFINERIKSEYLGYILHKPPIGTLGPLRIDIVYIYNEVFNIHALHLHFNFYNLSFKFGNKENIIKELAEFYCNVYDSFDCENISFSFLKNIKQSLMNIRRKYTYSLSRYVYISVYGLDKEAIKKWEKMGSAIWRLLYWQRTGIDSNIVSCFLEKQNWSGGNFYIHFYQPATLVSLSVPFPLLYYEKNLEWFIPKIDKETGKMILSHQPTKKDKVTDEDSRYLPPYDDLPEYPPLKYLGLLSLEYSGYIEETLRYIYEELVNLRTKIFHVNRNSIFSTLLINILQVPFLIFLLIFGTFKLMKIEHYYNIITNLEYLKLTITRKYISDLIDDKMQHSISENIKDIRTSFQNITILVLTSVGVFVLYYEFLKLISPRFMEIVYRIPEYYIQILSTLRK